MDMENNFKVMGCHQRKCLCCHVVDVPDYIRFCESCWKKLFEKFYS
jgi:hypothetical protein